MNKYTKRYYKDIKHHFPLMDSQEKKYLQKFFQYLERYEETHPDSSYDDYIDYFGEPDDIVSSFYEHIEGDYIVNRMKTRKIIRNTSLFLITIITIVALLFFSILYKEYVSLQELEGDYYFEEVIIESN